MNFITILIWITIAIIAAIAIISVRLHYRGNELEHEEGPILPKESINKVLNIGKGNNNSQINAPKSLSPANSKQNNNHNLFRKSTETAMRNDDYIIPEAYNSDFAKYEYQSANQVLINYDDTVEKFQEPIKQSQMDIMTQNNKDSSELKDLFTIDELIKESKRKDSEREKESQTIKKDDDAELDEIKESIKNKTQEPLIEEVIAEDKTETIGDLIKDTSEPEEIETPSEDTKSDEEVKIVEQISEVVLDEEKATEISEPSLKTPSKVENKADDANLFGDAKEPDNMDLDYRKDIDKVKNKIAGSRFFQDVKERFSVEPAETPQDQIQEEFIRNVSEYDEYEPIINETHVEYEATYDELHDEQLRQENTKRVFNLAKKSQEPELARPRVSEIKSTPERDNLKITINNGDFVLKKGDEIIFNHDGETYSSQVYAINGDEISVRYRRKDIKIKASDVKKIY